MKLYMVRSSFILLVCLVQMFCLRAQGQKLTGAVTDEQGKALPNVSVIIPALGRHMPTKSDGSYDAGMMPQGIYAVGFHRIGYADETREVKLEANDIRLDVTLHSTPLEVPGITVSVTPQPINMLESPQPVSSVGEREFTRNRGQSVLNSIEDLPGVSTFARGPISMKPVIRGLTSQRVVVVEDGMRHESQQWDDEQSPEVDVLDLDRIEVVRGPNSVLYGSDALGGVVNFLRSAPTTLSDVPARLGGTLLLNGFSNNDQAAGGLTLFGTSDNVSYKGQLSARHSDDIRTPHGALFNSGAKELNGSGSLGFRGDWGSLGADFSHFGQEIHIHPEEDAAQPSPAQRISHEKINISYNGSLAPFRLELRGTYQQSERAEYDDSAILDFADSAAIRLKLKTLSFDAKLHHNPIGRLFGTIGASVMNQKNETLGLEPLIPGFTQINVAGFLYEEYRMTDVSLSGGLRFDVRKLEVDENDDLGVRAQSRDYNAVTGTAGVVWRAAGPLSFSLNLGRGWRSPIAEELFINGTDEGSIRYKVGEPGLSPEESFNIDISTRYISPAVRAEVSVFRNRINRYIFLSPTGEVDSSSGFEKYRQQQANATLSGGELSFQTAATENVILRGGLDMVFGRNEETDSWLPLIPAHRIKLGITLTGPSAAFFLNPYLSFGSKITFDQNKIDGFEIPTGGYTLFSAGFGGEIMAGSRRVRIDCSAENLFDKAYFDHLSRYKDYALNPGRNIALKITVPFTIVD